MFDESHTVGYHSLGGPPAHEDTVVHGLLGPDCPCHEQDPVELTSRQQDTIDIMAVEFECVRVDHCPPRRLGAVLATPCRHCPTCGGDGCGDAPGGGCRKCDGTGAIPMRVPRRILEDGTITSAATFVPID